LKGIKQFRVSVIIPVYNAEAYLKTAVESAAELEEVGEVLLVEDASPDNALEIAQQLEHTYKKVRLFQHPDKGNHGAGASRNLGIEKATCQFIAFLDADDYYLPDRFKRDKELFLNNEDCDGVYNATGTHFYSEEAKQQFFEKGFGYQEVLTLTDPPSPTELFSVLFNRHPKIRGQFHTNSLTINKNVFEKVGYFNTYLRLRQDIHLWRRLAAYCNLYAGQIEKPVAMRGIHAANRMTVKKDHQQYFNLWWNSLKKQFQSKTITQEKMSVFMQCYYNYRIKNEPKPKALVFLIKNVIYNPGSIMASYGDFDFNFWHVFGQNWLTLRIVSFKNRALARKS
jgi:glycosyltransferase involved in cell wall biosynthesis